MKNLKNILTKINFAFGIEVQGPCCKAVNFYSFNNGSLQELRYLYQQYQDNPSLLRSNNASELFYSQLRLLLQEALTDFLNNFCDCKNTPRISIDTEVMPTPTSSPGAYVERVSENSQENRCASLLFTESFYEGIQGVINNQSQDVLQGSILHSRNSFGRVLQLLIDIVKNAAKNNPLANHPRTDNIDNFLNDWCNASLQYRNDILGKLSINKQLTAIVATSWGEINIGISDESMLPERICVPVLDEETQSSLPALGISETAIISCLVGVGLYAGRGQIKSVCRRLLGLNKATTTAAVAACVAASMQRTGNATVNPNDPALRALIDDVLDKTCSESGQRELFRCDDAMEGGEDAGGEVDAPGGGDVGAGGGLL